MSRRRAMVEYAIRQRPASLIGKAVSVAKHATIGTRKHYVESGRIEPAEDIKLSASILKFADLYRPYTARYGKGEDILRGVFTFRGLERRISPDDPIDWHDPSGGDPLFEQWEHDLTFFGWSCPLVEHDSDRGLDRVAVATAELESVLARDPRHPGFGWSPIAMAFRIFSLVTCLAQTRELDAPDARAARSRILAHVRLCERRLRLLNEDYLGYNHAVFGRVALAVATELTAGRGNEDAYRAANILGHHLLADGAWPEPSATYHSHMLHMAQILEVLLERDEAFGRALNTIRHHASSMRDALSAMTHPDGEIALFSDSALGDALTPAALGARVLPSGEPGYRLLGNLGLFRGANGGSTVLMDVGPFGPRDVVGHCHVDFLSIEMSVAMERLVVDTGVLSVAAGAEREVTRSIDSHNGPRCGDHEPVELFGAWRAGRRGSAMLVEPPRIDGTGTLRVAAQASTYENRAPYALRALELREDGTLVIDDSWLDSRLGAPIMSLTIGDDWIVTPENSTSLRLQSKNTRREVHLSVVGADGIEVSPGIYCTHAPWSRRTGTRLTMRPKDTSLTTTIAVARPRAR